MVRLLNGGTREIDRSVKLAFLSASSSSDDGSLLHRERDGVLSPAEKLVEEQNNEHSSR